MSDVDLVAFERTSPGRRLSMQVVRGEVDPSFWGALTSEAKLVRSAHMKDIAASLATAIKHKARRYPATQRSDLVLVIDCSRLPAYTFTPCTEALRAQFGDDLQRAGFRSVWLVGASDEAVFRVDAQRLPHNSRVQRTVRPPRGRPAADAPGRSTD